MPRLYLLLLLAPNAHAESSLHFDGVNDHVTMGEAYSLGVSAHTVECWFRWDGEGEEVAETGTGGLDMYPLVTKGRGESDGGAVDMNFGLGVDQATGALAADFEDMASGTNHPVVGITDVRDGSWHHAAVSYDGSTWALYLDGRLDTTLDTGGATPRYDSAQHFGVATAMNSSGTPQGRFRGAIDEVRLWSEVRTQAEIQAHMNGALSSGIALLARWGFDEGGGDTASDDVWSVDGTVVGASWTSQAPFDASLPPDEPFLVHPADGAGSIALSPTLEVQVDDPEGDPLEVRFFGRPYEPPAEDFTIVALPDTQYYCSGSYGGQADMFYSQTSWIVEQREALNIVYVAHEGDLVNDGDDAPEQWLIADEALSILEDPVTTGLYDGIPYGIAAGNHDQSPLGDPNGTTDLLNKYFGVDRSADRAYYGDHWDENNDDHYVVFDAGGMSFLVLDLEYDQSGADTGVLDWADQVITAHPDHRVMVVGHHLIEEDGELSDQGQDVYAAIGHHDSLFMMLSGHLTAEVWRSDPAGDTGTVYTLMADYKFDGNGGDGWLRFMEFSPSTAEIHIQTYSPWLDESQKDSDSDFVLPYDMGENPFTQIGTVSVAAGESAQLTWDDLDTETPHEWYVEVDDGSTTTTSPTWTFTTGDGTAQPGDSNAPDDTGDDGPGVRHPDDRDCGCTSGATPAGLGLLLALLGVARRRRR